jgi:hypothetical protein
MTEEAEKRGYARGYAAGRKRNAEEQAKWEAIHAAIGSERMQRRDRFFCAALTGLIQRSWNLNGKPAKTMEDHVELARQFAITSMEKLPDAY